MLHTHEVTGSNPVRPTKSRKNPAFLMPEFSIGRRFKLPSNLLGLLSALPSPKKVGQFAQRHIAKLLAPNMNQMRHLRKKNIGGVHKFGAKFIHLNIFDGKS